MEPSEEIEHASCVLNVLHNAATNQDTEQILNCFSDDGTFCLGSERVWHAHAIIDGGFHSLWQLLGRQPSSRTIQEVDSVGTRSIIIAKFEEQFEDEGHGSAEAFGSICYDTNSSSGSEGWKILRYQLLLPASLEESGDPQVLPPYQPRVDSMENQVSTSSSVSTAEPCGRIQIHESRPITPESIVEKRLLLMDTADSSSSENLSSSEDPRSHEVTEVECNEARPGAYAVRGRAIGEMPVWMESLPAHERSQSLHSQSSSNIQHERAVSAVLVDDDQLEANIRNQIISNAAKADVVQHRLEKRCIVRIFIISLFLLFVGLIIGLLVGLMRNTNGDSNDDQTDTPSIAPTTPHVPTIAPTTLQPTIQEIIARDSLRCGISDTIGFGTLNNITGEREGFGIDLCKAMAATILGNSRKIEIVVVTFQSRFHALDNKTVDVLSQRDTFTMERDIKENSTGVGFSFSTPFLYEGLGFAGKEQFVTCADSLRWVDECENVQICVVQSTTHMDIIATLVPEHHIVKAKTLKSTFELLSRGACNVIAGEQSSISEAVAKRMGCQCTENYILGKTLLSNEPVALVTRDDDPQWTSVVTNVVEILLLAEEQNVTKPNILAIGGNSSSIDSRFRNAVQSVGNYGEIYERHLQPILPRQGLNLLYNNYHNRSTGLLYSFPFGDTQKYGPKPQTNGTIQTILNKGKFRCGVVPRIGFAHFNVTTEQWDGLDIDYCRAVTLSIFKQHNISSKFEVVQLPRNKSDEHFTSLLNGSIDILLGGRYGLEQNIQEPSFESGFAFSVPYYYNNQDYNSTTSAGVTHNTTRHHSLSLVTRNDDPQWSAFVNWIVISTFYAEEKGIKQSTANNMPLVNLFGEQYTRMFRDTIAYIGNYEEMYTRHLEKYIPRGGRNLLNKNPFGPQHQSLLSVLDTNGGRG